MTSLIIRHPDGSTAGADPRQLGRAALEQAGYSRQPLLKIVRSKCADCCIGQIAEIARCTATGCALWPYRMGTDPFTGRKGGVFPPLKKPSAMPGVLAASVPSAEGAA